MISKNFYISVIQQQEIITLQTEHIHELKKKDATLFIHTNFLEQQLRMMIGLTDMLEMANMSLEEQFNSKPKNLRDESPPPYHLFEKDASKYLNADNPSFKNVRTNQNLANEHQQTNENQSKLSLYIFEIFFHPI